MNARLASFVVTSALCLDAPQAFADTTSMPATTQAPTTQTSGTAPQGEPNGDSVDRRARAKSPQPASIGEALVVGRTAQRHDKIGLPPADARVAQAAAGRHPMDAQVARSASAESRERHCMASVDALAAEGLARDVRT